MNRFPEISFVIVNYNGINDTRELLKSMKCYLELLSYEVIIVDNGSVENEAIILSKDFPEHIVIRSNKNLGFAGGNNLGIKASSGRYIMLINNDTLLIDDSICELMKMLERNPLIGAVSPKIYFKNPPKTIQFTGFTELTKITLRNRSIGYNELDTGQYETPKETAYTHGAAMMVRREVIEKVGLMPEIYFLYYEELDWCSQIKKKGFEIWYQPSALVIHKDSQSVGTESYLRFYYMTRNRILFALRNRKGLGKIMAVVYQLMVSIPTGMFRSTMKGRFDLVKAYYRGTIDLGFLKNKFS